MKYGQKMDQLQRRLCQNAVSVLQGIGSPNACHHQKKSNRSKSENAFGDRTKYLPNRGELTFDFYLFYLVNMEILRRLNISVAQSKNGCYVF